ncbi:ALTO [Sus scrofa polyomavirus 1]|uniref:ALTO n=1 Tax=Sus scrofa polyomavirus 1 TaxID=1680894 RepID=A0A5J6XUA7_9POLY|nr:ALTO [Sus scrofa polyomavirus 1]
MGLPILNIGGSPSKEQAIDLKTTFPLLMELPSEVPTFTFPVQEAGPVEDPPPDTPEDPLPPQRLLSLQEALYLPHAPHLPQQAPKQEAVYLEIPSLPSPPQEDPRSLQSQTSSAQRPWIRLQDLQNSQDSAPPLPPRLGPLPPLPMERDLQRLQREVLMMEQVLSTLQEAFRARRRSLRRQKKMLFLLIFLLALLTISLTLYIVIKQ